MEVIVTVTRGSAAAILWEQVKILRMPLDLLLILRLKEVVKTTARD
jgi:hypothetical protein